jgi:ATP-dependent RNA helicase DDX52/ROK1
VRSYRIVNVMRTSGCEVPPWMLELKNPSQKEKKKLKMRPVARKDVSRTSGSGDGAKGDRKRVKRTRVMGWTAVTLSVSLDSLAVMVMGDS